MPEAFEELAVREIDGLYHGALFLAAGDEAEAQDLLLEVMAGSFETYRAGGGRDGDPARWLEGRLARLFLGEGADDHGKLVAPGPREELFGPEARERLDGLRSRDLYRGARGVPERARAVLFLVLLRRWSYREAAKALEMRLEELKELLRYRHAFVAAILGNRPGGRLGSRTAT